VTATSANCKVMARAWRTTRAPSLISLSCKLIPRLVDWPRRNGPVWDSH
jgi:hypothetical protein